MYSYQGSLHVLVFGVSFFNSTHSLILIGMLTASSSFGHCISYTCLECSTTRKIPAPRNMKIKTSVTDTDISTSTIEDQVEKLLTFISQFQKRRSHPRLQNFRGMRRKKRKEERRRRLLFVNNRCLRGEVRGMWFLGVLKW